MFIAISLLAVLNAEAPPPPLSVPQAIAAIGRDEDVDRAVTRLRAAGKPGVWALHGAAKEAHATERGRLFEGIGRVGGSEAEWALITELSGSDANGVVGAVRGLARLGEPRVVGNLLRHATSAQEPVRDAIVEALAQYGMSPAQLDALLAHEREEARETAVRTLARAGTAAQRSAAIPAAMADPAPRVRRAALALVVAAKDQSQVFTIAELARGSDPVLAIEAVRALQALGGWNVPGMLSAVVAHPSTQPAVRVEAATVLRAMDRAGLNALVKASSEVKAPEALYDIAARALSGGDLDAVIELLEDPAHRTASTAILDRVGALSAQQATARQATALPELHAAIAAYLLHQKGNALTSK